MLASSLAALCTDFYVNSRLAVKMDLPADRQAVLELFSRLRKDFPKLGRFKRFQDELALESDSRDERFQQWVSLRRTSVRAGVVGPEEFEQAYTLHRLLLDVAPFYLSINPLDLQHIEVTFGFDLESGGNHHAIIHEALLAGSPLAVLMETADAAPIEVQPLVGVSLTESGDLRAYLDIKARTNPRDARRRSDRETPISVFLTVRSLAMPSDIHDLPKIFDAVAKLAERIAERQVVPGIIRPLREAIASQRH